MTKKTIRGSGGGGGGGSSGGHEASDTLRSKQIATVVDVLCEGPILGLVNGAQSIFLNETPLQNPDGSGMVSDGPYQNKDGTYNFVDVAAQFRNGTQNQLPFDGISDVEFETAVGLEVKQTTPIIKTVTNLLADSVRVTVAVPSLTTQDTKTGDLNGGAVEFRIETRSNGGSFVERIHDTIKGKTTSRYQRAYLVSLDGTGPWDIRVTRITPDPTNISVSNHLYWDSMTGVIDSRLSYPNTASVAMRIDSAQFGSIPSRAYGVKGLIVSVPSNYDPVTRNYTGMWDGTFKQAWTDNPAWCFYDMLTARRYGLGDIIPSSMVDKWSLYTIGKYCDELVPSGFKNADGSDKLEPRFTCNLYLQSAEEAYKVIQNFASIFRAITFWGAGSITAMQDRPVDPLALYTNANVIDGAFNYSGTSLKQRHTVALVSWNDPKDFYRQKVEYVQDDDGIKSWGVVPTEVTALGCASKGQAHRMGQWLLLTEKYATETVTFRSGLDGAALYPGAIINSSDVLRAGVRMGGRIASGMSNSVVLDSDFVLAPGKSYSLSVVTPSGKIATSAITSPAGTLRTLSLATALGEIPQANAVFIITANDIAPEAWRVIGVSEVKDDGGATQLEVSAIAHFPGLFATVEKAVSFTLPATSAIKLVPDVPANLTVKTSNYQINGAMVGLRATLSWEGTAASYRVRWRRALGAWTEIDQIRATSIDIDSVDYDTYSFSVVAVSSIGRESSPATLEQALAAPAVVLPDVTGLAIEGTFTTGVAKFRWDAVSGATSTEVKVVVAGVTKRTINVGGALRYELAAADMIADGGPWRNFTLTVRALGPLGAASANAASLDVSNPQIGALAAAQVDAGVNSIFFKCAKPTDSDFAGLLLYMGTAPNFTINSAAQVYDGPDVNVTINKLPDGNPLVIGTTYYIRAAGYDAFGKDSLTLTSSLTASPTGLAPTADSITAIMLRDGILDVAKFAQGIEPIKTVTAVPTTKATSTIFNTTDGKLYRWSGTAYVATVPTADLTGQVADSQIAAVAASKISGTIADTQIAAVAAAKLTGQLVDAQVAAIAASKVTGTLTDSQLAGISAAKLAGQITTTQIAPDSITTPLIKAGAVVAASLATDAVTADKIAANAITAGKIAANTITGSNIAGETITGSNIKGGTITAGNIAADAITATLIAANAVTAKQLAAGSVTVDKLVVTSQGQAINPDPHLEDIAHAWGTDSGITIGYNTAAPGASGGTYFSAVGKRDQKAWSLQNFIVDPSKVYKASAKIFNSGSDSNAYVYVNFFDSAFNLVASGWGGAMSGYTYGGVPPNNSSFTECGGQFGFGTARPIPANVKFCQIGVWLQYAGNGSGSGQQAVQDIRLERANDGSLIVDGVITASKVAANAITAGNIQAGAVTAGALSADSVVAGKIASGAISAREIAAGAITANALAVGSFDNVVPDPHFDDMTWWGRPTQATADYIATNAPWKSRRTMFFDNRNAALSDSFSSFFDIVPGSVYKIEYQIFKSADFQGRFSPIFHLPSQAWYTANQPGRGYSFSSAEGGMPVLFDGNSPAGFYTYSDVFTLNNTVQQRRMQIRLTVQCTAGYIEFGGLSITRVSDSTLIKDGAITTAKIVAGAVSADKLSVNSLQAVSGTIGLLRTATWGGRVEIQDNQQRIYDDNNVLRVKIGYLG